MSHSSRKFYFNGRSIAEKEFTGTSKSDLYRQANRLVAKGWFELITPPERDKRTGHYTPAIYRPLTHDEWAAKFPDEARKQCRYLTASESSDVRNEQSPASPTGGTGACPTDGTGQEACPNNDVSLSQDSDPPVPKSASTCPTDGTYLSKEKYVKEKESKEKKENNPDSFLTSQNPATGRPQNEQARLRLFERYKIWFYADYNELSPSKEQWNAIESCFLSTTCNDLIRFTLATDKLLAHFDTDDVKIQPRILEALAGGLVETLNGRIHPPDIYRRAEVAVRRQFERDGLTNLLTDQPSAASMAAAACA